MSTEHPSQWEIPGVHLFPVRAHLCSGTGSALPAGNISTRSSPELGHSSLHSQQKVLGVLEVEPGELQLWGGKLERE